MTEHVSRETPSGMSVAPPASASAREVFEHSLAAAEQFAHLLAVEATVRGLIGPREVPRLWNRHLLNCAVVADLMPDGSTVCDIGSGAGLPGIVLAIRRPDLHLTLVEPLLRRTTFLDLVVSTMELTNVTVRRARAEELHGEAVFDVVTSRAVAPMERLSRWSLPLVRPGGVLLAMKGAAAAEELEPATPELTKLGGVDARVRSVGEEWLSPPVTVVQVRRAATYR